MKLHLFNHELILKDTTTIAKHFIALVIFTSFAYASRANITILYALTFSNNLRYISIIIYIGSLLFAISSLIGSIIANTFGFDKIAIILLFFYVFGILIESIAWNINI